MTWLIPRPDFSEAKKDDDAIWSWRQVFRALQILFPLLALPKHLVKVMHAGGWAA